jgi:hypothetical protein
LAQALLVTGTVCDAVSREPIPRFQVDAGWPERQRDGSLKPAWLSSRRLSFTEGKFQHTFDSPIVLGTTNMGYVLRFEAEGYAPFVTRVVRPDEGQVQLDIKLNTAEETVVAIFTPAGQAAAHAEVGLVAPGSRLKLAVGSLSNLGMRGSPWLRTADAQGHFVLPTDPEVQSVVPVHPAGFVECSVADLRQARSATLRPWGCVEGVWLADGQPVSQRQVSLRFGSRRDRALELDLSVFMTQTDDAGHFLFPQVPATELEVFTWRPLPGGRTNVPGSRAMVSGVGRRAAAIQVQPGQTNQVALNGEAGPRTRMRSGDAGLLPKQRAAGAPAVGGVKP